MSGAPRKVFQAIAQLVQARANCIASGNKEWEDRHTERVFALVKNCMPSGSGFDTGTTIDWARSTSEKLVFDTAYHHMNEVGYYDGWTEHTVTVTPSLTHDFDLKISGRNRNDIKDVVHEVFDIALREPEPVEKEAA
jgi:hypothetical protein